jgi:hypothetical protein
LIDEFYNKLIINGLWYFGIGIKWDFFGLNGIDFLDFNPPKSQKSIPFNPKKSHLILIPKYHTP